MGQLGAVVTMLAAVRDWPGLGFSIEECREVERTAVRWATPQKPGTSVRVDSAVGQMRMFRPRNKWAVVQENSRREEQEGPGRGSEWVGAKYVINQLDRGSLFVIVAVIAVMSCRFVVVDEMRTAMNG